MLKLVKKIPLQVVLLIVSLAVISLLDVFFVNVQKGLEDYTFAPNSAAQPALDFNYFIPLDIGESAVCVKEETPKQSDKITPINLTVSDQLKVKSKSETTKPVIKTKNKKQVKLRLKTKSESKTKQFVTLTPITHKNKTKASEKAESYYSQDRTVEITKCAKESFMTAINVRSIQTKLMVAALSCPGARSRYNQFVLKYKIPLKLNATVMMNYFKCKVGSKAVTQFDDTITKIANAAAAVNSDQHEYFCNDVEKIFDELDDAEADDLVNVAKHHTYLGNDFFKK